MSHLIAVLNRHIFVSYLFIFFFFYLIFHLLDLRLALIRKIVAVTKSLSSSKAFLILFFLSSFLVLSFFANSVLQRFPIVSSEYNYIYQGETLSLIHI